MNLQTFVERRLAESKAKMLRALDDVTKRSDDLGSIDMAMLRMARRLTEAAQYEGEHVVWTMIDIMLAKGVEEATIQKRLIEQLLRGPDDGWSGRGNDAARARFDGITKATSSFREHLEYGE